mmetsp:Transcript_21346/g.60109  ORF Transcript_21346/g.60109 Transcript_21346/m.60109 type:complete len:248 (-) Transcript_21346:220-963(-)
MHRPWASLSMPSISLVHANAHARFAKSSSLVPEAGGGTSKGFSVSRVLILAASSSVHSWYRFLYSVASFSRSFCLKSHSAPIWFNLRLRFTSCTKGSRKAIRATTTSRCVAPAGHSCWAMAATLGSSVWIACGSLLRRRFGSTYSPAAACRTSSIARSNLPDGWCAGPRGRFCFCDPVGGDRGRSGLAAAPSEAGGPSWVALASASLGGPRAGAKASRLRAGVSTPRSSVPALMKKPLCLVDASSRS